MTRILLEAQIDLYRIKNNNIKNVRITQVLGSSTICNFSFKFCVF